MAVLGLKLPTERRWVELVKKDLETTMSTHAWAEQKAASYAISLIVRFPQYDAIVETMSALAIEEMGHFRQVYQWIKKKGFTLKPVAKDDYVNDLWNFVRKGGSQEDYLMDRLLLGAMIEARSCERFKVLTQYIHDEELAKFYRDLMASEARHYTTFIKLAKQYLPAEEVDKRWKAFLDFEAEVMKHYNKSAEIHG